MKTTHKISLLILLVFGIFNCKAQIPTDIKMALQHKIWIVGNNEARTLTFTNTEMIASLDGEVIGKAKYHLTNNYSDIVFDPSKVGVVSNGKYMLTENHQSLIMFINPYSFKIGNINNGKLDSWTTYNSKP